MKLKKISISYEEYEEGEKLASSDTALIDEASKALSGSYAPYSEFHVGAALLLDDGRVVRGSNQENAAYPSGLCAERVALFHASSQYPDQAVVSLAIIGKAENFVTTDPITPCGACRQVIAETEKRQGSEIRVIMKGEKGVTRIVEGIDSLLPMVFNEDKLKKSNK